MKKVYLVIITIVALFFLGCDKTDTLKDEMSIDKEN